MHCSVKWPFSVCASCPDHDDCFLDESLCAVPLIPPEVTHREPRAMYRPDLLTIKCHFHTRLLTKQASDMYTVVDMVFQTS